MKSVKVYHYDAFTKTAGLGNPAGVIVDADVYSTEDMQEIAHQIGFSECAFVRSSDKADLQLRYFTPGSEVNLCGHATMASIYALFNHMDSSLPPKSLNVETKAGIIDVTYAPDSKEVSMTQADAEFRPFTGDVTALAAALGLGIDDIDGDYPIVFGSTGLWTVIVPVKTLEAMGRMKSNNSVFPDLFPEIPNASVHPICQETIKDETLLHGRHFSAPQTGRVEDPITGTACGVMGAYYITYMNPGVRSVDMLIEQGQDAGYDGVVHVWARKEGDATKVKIAGTAVFVKEMSAAL